MRKLADEISEYPDFVTQLRQAIVENPPMTIRDGGVIARGYDKELDELLAINENAGEFLIQLEAREKQRTGFSTLRKWDTTKHMVTTLKLVVFKLKWCRRITFVGRH